MRTILIALLLRHWRYVGLFVGIVAGAAFLVMLSFPERNTLVARGPMNAGHEALSCQECHVTAEGTAAQQASSNVYHWLGLRESAISFGSENVTSKVCLDCHQRHNDRHPISRFLEPRFSEARRSIKAYECETCHTEHQGKRVTLSTISYCMHCHQDTALENDPISPSHVELVKDDSWTTCLQCHDFHGNHMMTTPVDIREGVSEERIWRYFMGGPSPYGTEKHEEPSETRMGNEP